MKKPRRTFPAIALGWNSYRRRRRSPHRDYLALCSALLGVHESAMCVNGENRTEIPKRVPYEIANRSTV